MDACANGGASTGSVGRAWNALMFYKESCALTLTLILAYSAMTLSTVALIRKLLCPCSLPLARTLPGQGQGSIQSTLPGEV